MKAIGSHPGAILFRFGVMVILISILVLVFFDYVDRAQQQIERKSVQQTKRIVDSSLAVVFSTYAINGRLRELDELDGGNPFGFLSEFEMLPPTYRGAIEHDIRDDLDSGWYYLQHRRLVAYKSFYLDDDLYFRLALDFQDQNRSGRFEPETDIFNGLHFARHR